ncbi:PTS sugar transporter subunit IIA [Desulfobaculum senezii]|jgi:PTS system nitrogen regulatory IIA component
MKLGDFVDSDLIFPELSARTKSSVLAELVAGAAQHVQGIDPEQAKDVLLERESLGTTGIGDGIAIPHGKLEGLDDIVVVAARSREGVDFDALDFKPCHIFFLVLAPEKVAGMHLRILAHISRTLKDEKFRTAFLEAGDKDELVRLIKGA